MWQVQEIQHCEDELLRLSELARIWIVDDLENRQQSGDAEAFDEAGNHQSKAERNLPPKTMLPEHPEGVGEGRGAKDFVFSHMAANRRRTFRDMPVWRAGLLNTGCPLVNLDGLPASGPGFATKPRVFRGLDCASRGTNLSCGSTEPTASLSVRRRKDGWGG